MQKVIELVTQAAEILNAKNPADLAEAYASLPNDKQAAFWDLVAFEFSTFGAGMACQQNCEIADRLTHRAADHIRNLAAHIEDKRRL